ncbi:ATP-binding protein [Hymenobacter sp. BT175]|uniref:sensor histidine kinase n=1 Tax=Hymenobacter translucens TaxID=2886507 RepID=UPI001D0ECA73|nr:ATP-binding protein [Hymenobacter translucens]MCC2546581.1 ATP-binding protein [Hymenobacter translucens]
MTFKRVEFGIALRLIGLLLLLAALLQAGQRGHYVLAALALLLLALAVWELGRHVTRGNRALADFLLAIKYRDFAQHYNEAHVNGALHAAFNQLNATFRQLSAEREAQFTYVQTVLQLIDTGIVTYDEQGQVESVNETFRQLLEVPYLKQISALQRRHPGLLAAINALEPGAATVVRLVVGRREMQLLLSATRFRLQNREFTLLALKNVSQTLEETETEAWQKLLRVMTHEIMNSVAPIASLADTLRRDLHRELSLAPPTPGADHELLDDVLHGIGIIQHRSEGLLRFAQVYRDFSTIGTPRLAPVPVAALFSTIRTLMASHLAEGQVDLRTSVEPAGLELLADAQLLEQVLINLVLNAAYAVRQTPAPRIRLLAREVEAGRVVIEVADNGTGIAPEVLDSIFIPFFTTRAGGTGIGLSLAKQIMRLHRGSIKVQSVPDEGTVFQLEF